MCTLCSLYLILLLIVIDFVKVGHHHHAPTRLLSGPLSAFIRDHSSPSTAHYT